MKPRRMRLMRCAGHVASMVEMKNACNILVRNPEGKRSRGDLMLTGDRQVGCIWAGFFWLRIGTS
jgi:hypothetical protein